MNVTIGEAWKNQFSCGVDDFGSHAAHFFDARIVANGDDFCAADGYSLCPWLLGIFRVNAAVDYDNICRFDDEALPS